VRQDFQDLNYQAKLVFQGQAVAVLALVAGGFLPLPPPLLSPPGGREKTPFKKKKKKEI